MAHEVEDMEDDSFESALAERRHRELTGIMKGLANAIPKSNGNSSDLAIKEAIKNQTTIIKEFIDLCKKEGKQEVKVELNQEKVVNSMDGMAKSILSALNVLKQSIDDQKKPKEWEFKVTRNSFSDLIDTIIVKQK